MQGRPRPGALKDARRARGVQGCRAEGGDRPTMPEATTRRPSRSSTKRARSASRVSSSRAQDRGRMDRRERRAAPGPTRPARRARASRGSSRPSSACAAVAPRQTSTSRLHHRDLRFEPRPAGGDLRQFGFCVDAPLAARLPLEVLDGVRHVDASRGRCPPPRAPRRAGGPPARRTAGPRDPPGRRAARRRASAPSARRPRRRRSASRAARAGTPGSRPRLRGARPATAAPAGTPRQFRYRRSASLPVTYQQAPLLHRFVDSPVDMVSSMSENGRLRALAELASKVGANVDEGQYVLVTGARRACAARARDRERLLRERGALRRCGTTSTSTCGAR